MHFSIPDTQEVKFETGSSYTAFNVHVNGVLHCSVRYSQLHDLNEQLKDEFGIQPLPQFPPKKFLTLNSSDLDERRIKLEKYVQDVSQIQEICGSITFNTFLRRAQQETRQEQATDVSLNIYLLNGSKIRLDISSTTQTEEVLEKAMEYLGISENLITYFSLFLYKTGKGDRYSIVRELQDFESPYISLKALKDRLNYKMVIRTNYWDISVDEIVLQDKIGLNLLHIQAQADMGLGWIECTKENKQRLESLLSKGSKKEYMKLCQTLTNYKYIQFDSCTSDKPAEDTNVIVSVGNYQVKLRYIDQGKKEDVLSVTRIKSWKQFLYQVSSNFENKVTKDKNHLQISFEYLVSKNTLQWITLVSEQAIMISMCIKSMVDELIRKRSGSKIKKPANSSNSPLTYKARDKTTQAFFDSSQLKAEEDLVHKAKHSVKKFSEKFSSFKLNIPVSETPPQHFDVARQTFEKIGDDDL